MNSLIMITKRSGEQEEFDPEKIHRVLFWATDQLGGVSVSQLEMKAQLQLYNGIKTTEIHEILIAAAHELIQEDTPNYQWVAARLRLFQIRKEAIDQFQPWPLYQLISRNVNLGLYTIELLTLYSIEEVSNLDEYIDHERDFTIAYAGMEQLRGKYLVQHRKTHRLYETPQYLFMVVSMMLFHRYPGDTRIKYVKEFYDMLSKSIISLPTPIMGGLRTKVKQFSSCVLLETADTLKSINATSNAIVEYVSRKAGIGLEAGHIRAIGSDIRGGDAVHTGVTPFYRLFESAVRSTSQGAIRNGAATLYAPFWHLEIETILTLKNNKGTDEDSVRQIDYGIQFNRLAYQRLIEVGDITLFNPSEVADMHEAFFSDQDKFIELYETYEQDDTKTKKTLSAMDFFELFHSERKETGRIYVLNIDHANQYGPFNPQKHPIKMSNLCVSGDTLIRVKIDGNSQTIPIQTLSAYYINGQWDKDVSILSYDTATQQSNYQPIKVFAQTSPDHKVMKLIDHRTGMMLIATPEHPVYTVNRGYVMLKDLCSTDQLLVDTHHEISANHTISCEFMENTIPVYDITVEKNENFYANGILVHNCAEILLPTKPMQYPDDPNGRISLCTLSGINFGKLKCKEDIERPMELLVRALNEVLDYQDYPLEAAKRATMEHRPLGIGLVNLAYWLAKRNFKYSDNSALVMFGEYMEAFQYYAMKASNQLAKEQGRTCEAFIDSDYNNNIMPIDNYKSDLDEILPPVDRMDWDTLREDIALYGLLNNTLTAQFPSETSSQILNATNGIEPPRSFVTVKGSGEGRLKQVVPGYPRYKNKYELAWDMPDTRGYLNLVAVAQKFIDQTLSANTYYNPKHYVDEQVPLSDLIMDQLYFYKLGGKTLYYSNTYDGMDDDPTEDECGGACKL